GVLRLGREDELALLAQKSAIKTQHYRNEGRSSTNEETFRRLPQTGLGGWPLGHWQRRAFVTAEMWRVLEAARIEAQQLPIAPMGTAVDFTDGMGWLGYGLDVAGYLTVVVGEDTGAYGLGAFPYTRYLRVQALNWGLVAPDSCDLVVFSFSVAGLDDPAKIIEMACASLKVGGHLIVLADKAENRQDGEKFHAAETALKATGYPLEKRRVSAMGRKFSRL